jgi:Protein of unknown function (DUF3187)
MNGALLAMLIAVCALAPGTAAAGGEGAFYGLLRARDLSPFGFLRLDMRPAHAVSIEPGTWAFEAELGYQNTWALSPDVEAYLIGLEPTGRRPIGPAAMQAIRDLPGEQYLLDLETATLDLRVHYKISRNWSIYGIASAISYQGGFLDSTIENFHETFGFSSFGRPAIARNQTALIYDLKGAQATFVDTPTRGGFTDPTVGARYSGIRLSERWQVALEAAVKVPVGGRRLLLSTGRTDYGVQASIHRRGNRHAVHVDAAAVYYAGSIDPAPQDDQVIPTIVAGYEYRLTSRTNLNAQVYVSRSVYSRRQTDLDELLGYKYQYSIGVRHRIEQWLVSFAFTENVQNVNNTPDVGFQLGVAFLPRSR